MTKKVIQVPVDDELLKGLDSLSRKQHKARAELIRHACLRYLQETQLEELDRLYQQGYLKVPESPMMAEAQVTMAGEFLDKESW